MSMTLLAGNGTLDDPGERRVTEIGEVLAEHLDDAFAELMRSGPRYLVGPNGELIIAGGDHVLTGDRAP